MRTINLDPAEDKKYILLGDASIELDPMMSLIVMPKIAGEITSKVPGFWGKIDLPNGENINWSGSLKISENGNDSSSGVSLMEIQHIYATNPQLDNNKNKVIERFISFEDVHYNYPESFTSDELPGFRLTIMLEKNEGALVYYEYHDLTKGPEEEATISYIQPQPTGEDFPVDNRDRLSYRVELLPPRKIIESDHVGEKPFLLSEAKIPVKFLIKILTYIRGDYKNSKDVVQEQLSKIPKFFEKRQQLLIFKPENNSFIDCTGPEINFDLNTLLLLHGTFATTDKSFGALINSGWLLKIISDKKFEQILAFDHPTVFEDAESNMTILLNNFKGKNFKFPVSIIATSQGGLLAQYLANLPDPKPFNISKVALVASANGVKWVNVATGLEKFLSILKVICKDSVPALQFITGLAQHSLKFFLEQPGLELMRINSPKLNLILNSIPSSPNTRYLPIIDDFTKELLECDGLLKRLSDMGLDLVIRSALGPYNDWVVQSENQFLVPEHYCIIPGYNKKDFKKNIYPALHGRCLERKDVQEKIRNFI